MIENHAYNVSPPVSPPHQEARLAGTRLSSSPFLSGDERRALDDAVLSSRAVNAGANLVREGERANSLFLVTKGWACRYTTTASGSGQLLALLLPGDICNPDSLLFDGFDYGVRTLTQATIVTLPRDRTMALVTEHPGIAQTFIWLGLVENAILRKCAFALGRQSAKERLAHLLCELSVRLGNLDANETSFEFPLTQEQIADALGLTAVHVNRTMHLLRSEGLIATDRRTITIPDVSRLRRTGGFDPGYLHILQDGPDKMVRIPSRPLSSSTGTQFSYPGQ